MKKTIKIFALIVALVMLFSTVAFADEEPAVQNQASISEEQVLDGEKENEKVSEDIPPIKEDINADIPSLISTIGSEIKDDISEDLLASANDIALSMDDGNAQYIKNQDLDGDFFRVGSTINIEKLVVDGNSFIAGANLNLKDVEIYGNLFIAGETISFENVYVGGSIFMAGKNLSLTGFVANDIYGAANSISLDSVYCIRGCNVAGEIINISNSGFGGRANVAGSTIQIKVSEFSKDLNYSAPQQADIDEETKISGEINFTQEDNKSQEEIVKKTGSMFYFMQCVTFIVIVAVMAAFFIYGPKKYFEMARSEDLALSMLKSFGIGLLTIIVVPIIFVMLLITVVGMPIAFALLFIYIIFFIIASASMTCFIIFSVLKNRFTGIEKSEDKFKMLALVLVAGCCVWLIQALPIIGGLVGFILAVSGYGSLVRCIYLNIEKLKEKNNKTVAPVVKEEKADVVVEKEVKEENKDEDKKDDKDDN